MIVDAHSHWLPNEIITNAHFYHTGWGDIEAQVKMMDEAGIAQAVLSYPTSDAHLKLGGLAQVSTIFNDNVAAIIKRYPKRFIGAAILPVGNADMMLREWYRARDVGFQAISLATSYEGRYLDDKEFIPLYQEAQAHSIPIFVHPQIVNPIGFERVQDPLLTPVIEYVFDTTICIGKLMMSGVLDEYQEVKFVFAYFGGAIPFLAHRFDATYQMLRSINFVKDLRVDPTVLLKRVYVDTSGDTTQANLEAARVLFGTKHLVWGSDWPAKKNIGGSIQAISDLDLTPEEKDGILGGNLMRLFTDGG
ncbi:MAG TPA: amidohydrolase family protein [Candidatus Omnitrophota bacterium]|nr:amidohydrolase family protein [Candidatus Omnitrophota bacterium]HPT07049.1 amidohydrolase family protein [Candidatus Omnitrophota bacterium]